MFVSSWKDFDVYSLGRSLEWTSKTVKNIELIHAKESVIRASDVPVITTPLCKMERFHAAFHFIFLQTVVNVFRFFFNFFPQFSNSINVDAFLFTVKHRFKNQRSRIFVLFENWNTTLQRNQILAVFYFRFPLTPVTANETLPRISSPN